MEQSRREAEEAEHWSLPDDDGKKDDKACANKASVHDLEADDTAMSKREQHRDDSIHLAVSTGHNMLYQRTDVGESLHERVGEKARYRGSQGISRPAEAITASAYPRPGLSQPSHITYLALEIIEHICDNFDSERDISALSQASKELHARLWHYLYLRNVRQSQSSALFWAALNGSEALVKRMLSITCININARDKDGWTPLMHAASRGHDAIVCVLAGCHKIDCNARDLITRVTALSLAARFCSEKTVLHLLTKDNIDVWANDNFGRTALFDAAANGFKMAVESFRAKEDFDIHRHDSSGRTALSIAARCGRKEVVELLLNSGADPQHADIKGSTALLNAAGSGHRDIVELLLAYGADPQHTDERGWTMLFHAAANGREEMAKLLLTKKIVNPLHRDRRGSTALSLAVEGRHNTVERLLLITGKVDYESLLFAAALSNRVDLLHLAIGHVIPNIGAGFSGATQLLKAIQHASSTAVLFLIRHLSRCSHVDLKSRDRLLALLRQERMDVVERASSAKGEERDTRQHNGEER